MMQEGIEGFDQLLSVNPKAVPYRLQKIQTIRARANVYRHLKNESKAIEDDAIVTERGVEWLYPVNERVWVIK